MFDGLLRLVNLESGFHNPIRIGLPRPSNLRNTFVSGLCFGACAARQTLVNAGDSVHDENVGCARRP